MYMYAHYNHFNTNVLRI